MAARKKAFTLAEVLITLAIIGVVAALTIPVITAKIKDKKIETATSVFKTKILDTAGVMYAKGELDGTTSADFISKLGNYMKLTKTCNSSNLSDCFPSEINDDFNDVVYSLDSLTTPASLGQSYTNDNNVGGIMADGTKFILSFDPNCSIKNYSTAVASCMHMVVDLPISSEANVLGEDILEYYSTLNDSLTVGVLNDAGCASTSNLVDCGKNTDVIPILVNYGLLMKKVLNYDFSDVSAIRCGCTNNNCSKRQAVVKGCNIITGEHSG